MLAKPKFMQTYKCTQLWLGVILCYFIMCVASCKNHTIKVQNFYPLIERPPSPSPPPETPDSHQCVLCQFMISRLVYKGNYLVCNILRFLSWFSIIPLTTSHLSPVSVVCSSLWSDGISWSGWSMVCLIIHPPRNMWVVSNLGLLRTNILWAFMDKFLCWYVFTSLG